MRIEWRRGLAHAGYYSVAGLIGVAVLAGGWWAARHATAIDLSANQRHSLAPASIQALHAISDPVITAYMSPKYRARPQILDLVARYQRHRPTLKLQFIDPATISAQAHAEHIDEGDVVIASAERTAPVVGLTEQGVTRALLRLLHRDQQFIAFVTGHGERSPLRQANHDLSHWYEVLKTRGYQMQELNLADRPAIPDNTALLVIASPQIDYLPGERTLIADYVAGGGALLWLVEPDQPKSFDLLARTVGFEQLPATVLDPMTQALGIDNPAIAVVASYPTHAATAGLNAASLFPFATPIYERPAAGWQAARVLETNKKAWGETGTISGNVGYDENIDYPGPLPLAIALTRSHAGSEQRVMVIGDGDFLSNTYIGNSGNQDLGTHLVDWLAVNDALITIDSRTAPDVNLELTRWQQAVIGFGFLVILPLAFAVNGWVIGWRRRRA